MHAPFRRIALSSAFIALAVGACGSGGGTPTSAPGSNPASAPAASVPAASAPAASASSGGPSGVAGSPAASTVVSGAVPRPSGSPCDWLDKATIDASLGLAVGAALPGVGPKKDELCTWLSKAPAGGITLDIMAEQDFAGFAANYQKLPGGRLVPGLGVKAVAVFVTGQKAPLPASHAQVFVDYGDWVLSVDVSGPTVTVGGAEALAAAAVIQ